MCILFLACDVQYTLWQFCLFVHLLHISFIAWQPSHEFLPFWLLAVSSTVLILCIIEPTGGTAVSGLTRGLATLPQGGSRSLQWSGQDGRPQEDPLAVHCFCECSVSVLLGEHLGVSRSRECDLPSLLSIYPRIFFCIFIVYCHVVRILCLLLYSAICSCVLVALV